jgi:hypothetical protein
VAAEKQDILVWVYDYIFNHQAYGRINCAPVNKSYPVNDVYLLITQYSMDLFALINQKLL